MSNNKSPTFIPLLLAAAGILGFIAISYSLSFNNSIFGPLFQKQSSLASGKCTQHPPSVKILNTIGWEKYGAWAKSNQTIQYQVAIKNNDVGCPSSMFTLTPQLPLGFTQDPATIAFTLNSGQSILQTVYILSPINTQIGDYQIIQTAQRTNGPSSFGESLYKVYMADVTPPNLFWLSPEDKSIIDLKKQDSIKLSINSTDDHTPRKIELFIDGKLIYTSWADVSYKNSLSYTWIPGKNSAGAHKILYKAYDDSNNISEVSASLTLK
jgi:hypothetical protein